MLRFELTIDRHNPCVVELFLAENVANLKKPDRNLTDPNLVIYRKETVLFRYKVV